MAAYNPGSQTVGNYGLLEGLSEGANSFLNAYQTTKNINYQRNLQNLVSGVQQDPNTGALDYTPAKKQQIQAQGLMAQSQIREQDPNSNLASATSKFYAGQGYQVPEGLNYGEQKGLVEPLAEARAKAQYAAQNKQILKPTDWTNMGNDLDPTKARSGSMGDAQKLLNSTKRVDAVFDQFPNGQIPAAQTAELANAVAALYGGGSAQSQHQIDSIVPKTAQGDENKIASYFMNTPEALSQPEFIKVMRDSSNREKAVANQMLHDGEAAKMSKYPEYYEANPGRFRAMFNARGIMPEEIGPHGEYLPKEEPTKGMMNPAAAPQPQTPAKNTAQSHPEASAALAWAKDPKSPGWTQEKANAILQRLGQ